MEPQSIFEKFTEADVSHWVNLVAVISVLVGPAVGFLVGQVKKPLQRYLVLGCMLGLLGPALALAWHVVDARTSYWDYIYQDKNPNQEPRLLWPVLGAGKLDSVRNLAGLAVGFVLVGIAIGLGCGLALNWLDRRFPAQRAGEPQEGQEPGTPPAPEQAESPPAAPRKDEAAAAKPPVESPGETTGSGGKPDSGQAGEDAPAKPQDSAGDE
jgi:hypothetical protein